MRWADLRFLLIAAMEVAIGPLSIDMYLPAMPAIRQEFGATTGQIQSTMGVYLVGLTLG